MSPEDQPVAHTEDSTISSSSINQNEDCVSGNQEREDDDVTYGSTDGGYGWVIAIAACLIEMPCMTMVECWYVPREGSMHSETTTLHNIPSTTTTLIIIRPEFNHRGVMQDYYDQSVFPGKTVQLSLVATIMNVLTNLLGPLAQVLLAFTNTRISMLIGTLFCSAGLVLAGSCKTIWQLYMTFGVLYGTGSSIVFYNVLAILPLWFTKRRGVALAVASSGAPIGGFVFPPIINALISQYGIDWCCRVLALIAFACGMIATCMIRNHPMTKKASPSFKSFFQLDLLCCPPFILWCSAYIFIQSGYFVPFVYFPSNATYLGIDTDRGSALLSIFSGTNLIGRFLAGALADTIGHVNTLIIYTMLTSFGCFFLWMFATDFATLSAAAAVCGFFAGTFLTLTSSITAIVTTLEKLEGGISLFLVLTTVSMFGPSFAGAIEQRVSSDFLTYKIFTGSGYLAGALILISMKLCLVRSLTKKI